MKNKNTIRFNAHRVPPRDVDPSEQLMDFLHSCPYEWSGDSEGIVIFNQHDKDIPSTAFPGDWIVVIDSQWLIVSVDMWPALEQLVKGMQATNPMSKVPLPETLKGKPN